MNQTNRISDGVYRIVAYIIFLVFAVPIKHTYHLYPGRMIPELMLGGGMVICVEISILIAKYKYDDAKLYELFQATILPALVYFNAGFRPHGEIKTILIMAAVIGCLYFALMLWINISSPNKRKNHSYVGKVIGISLYNIRALFIIVLSVYTIYSTIICPVIAEKKALDRDVIAWSEERSLSANYDTLKVLGNEEEFSLITDQDERCELFKLAVDVEANYQGIPKHLSVVVRKLEEGCLAEYSDSEGTIYVDPDFLSDCTAEELVTVAAHEVFHGYEHELIRVYQKLKEDNDEESLIVLGNRLAHVETYIEEFSSYEEEGIEYYQQQVEIDARNYADQSCLKWMDQLSDIEKDI